MGAHKTPGGRLESRVEQLEQAFADLGPLAFAEELPIPQKSPHWAGAIEHAVEAPAGRQLMVWAEGAELRRMHRQGQHMRFVLTRQSPRVRIFVLPSAVV